MKSLHARLTALKRATGKHLKSGTGYLKMNDSDGSTNSKPRPANRQSPHKRAFSLEREVGLSRWRSAWWTLMAATREKVVVAVDGYGLSGHKIACHDHLAVSGHFASLAGFAWHSGRFDCHSGRKSSSARKAMRRACTVRARFTALLSPRSSAPPSSDSRSMRTNQFSLN